MARRALSAGSLRNLVTIQQASTSDDGRGGRPKTWSTYCTAWANIKPLPLKSLEVFAEQQVQGPITHIVTIRYQAGVRPKMRIVWGSRLFQVVGVITQDEERRVIVLHCVEERT